MRARCILVKSDVSEPQCTTKAGIQRLSLMCRVKNTVKVEKSQAWSSRENGTPNSVQKASNHNPTNLWKRAQTYSNSKNIQTNSKTPFLKTAAKLLTKEMRSVTLFSFPNHILISSSFHQSLLAAPDPLIVIELFRGWRLVCRGHHKP